MKNIAVLMTCYNRVATTLKCLQILFDQVLPTGYSLDVWLVDDASPDNTGKIVKSKYPQVNVIYGSGKLFWCKGMRLAWDNAAHAYDYDYYLWLNDDVILATNALAALVGDSETIERGGTKQYVISGPLASDDSYTRLCYGCYGRDGVLRPEGAPVVANDSYSMSGNIVLIPRSVFRAVGFIADVYSHAYGDSDYRQQMKKQGIPLYCSSVICGVCPLQPERYIHLRGLGFKGRIQALKSPKGFSIRDAFLYRYRNWGLFRAILSVTHIIAKVMLSNAG